MGVTILTCYRVDCDGCGKPVVGEDVEGYDIAPHCTTADQAVAHLHGDPDVDRSSEDGAPYPLLDGEQLGDGRILCGRCNSRRLHALHGHRWGEWQQCRAAADESCRIERHQETGCPEYRTCDRPHCDKGWQERPAAVAVSS